MEDEGSEEFLEQVLNKESLLELPLQKLISNYPINTDGSNTE
jgi:hypothetical protein